MKLVVNFSTPSYVWLIVFFNWLLLDCHCDSRTDLPSIGPDDSFGQYFQKLSAHLNRSPSVVNLRYGLSESIPKNVLRLYETEMLDLKDNRLTNLPIELANLTKLEYINLVGNRISDISLINVVNELPNLEHLILSKNPLKSLKGLRISSLLFLEANYCEITRIDTAILSSLPSLKSLNLTGNPVKVVQKLNSTNLTDLILTDCQISGLCFDAFRGLPNLHNLEMSGNKLNALPDKIFSTTNNLVRLSLSNNTLQKIKQVWFEKKFYLRELDLSENKISSINESVLADLFALSDLNLAGNRVLEFPNLRTSAVYINLSRNNMKNQKLWDLSNMVNLRSLDLSKNGFEGACDEFRSISLRILDLGFNNLTKISDTSFSALPNLMDLILKGNRFARAADLVFEENRILVDIDLEDNLWHCDCSELYPLYFYLTNEHRTKSTSLKCWTPENNRSATWFDTCSRYWKTPSAIDESDVSKTWLIAVASAFGVCVLIGSLVYIGYSFKRSHMEINT